MFDNIDGQTKLFASMLAGVGLKMGIFWWMREKRKMKFERVGTVTKLIVYPIKSCPGISVQEAQCTKYGLQLLSGLYDRHWMVTKPNGRFLSLRQCPKMALIKVKVTDTGLELEALNMKPFTVLFADAKKWTKTKCSVWDSSMDGYDCGDEAGAWLSEFLGTEGLRLVHYSLDLPKRNFNSEDKPWATRAVDGDWTGYADWGPYLLIPELSITELNKHLPRKVDERSFRPNIVIDGCPAFDEDNWEDVRFGDKIQMRCLDACTRCLLTTVCPDTGIKQEDGEPLKTLKRIRCVPPYDVFNEACFGINLAPDECGKVKVGDPVYAIRT